MIEERFDVSFIAKLTAEEKQIQQNYRPVIGVHKWFARRPGSLFRGLLLSEFDAENPLSESFFKSHRLSGLTIADPFMGGGTTLFEANRIGCNVVGFDINPMAFWIVRQELMSIDRATFRTHSEAVIADVAANVGAFYSTRCLDCGNRAEVKYFLWVKQQRCASCDKDSDLFPGYLIAENIRHPNHVFHCPSCCQLVEFEKKPSREAKVQCPSCSRSIDWYTGSAIRNKYTCRHCSHVGKYPAELREDGPPRHRLFGIEYHCHSCKPTHSGRFFKTPDADDLDAVSCAQSMLAGLPDLPIPDDSIPDGDETKRLHRWGYHRYRDMFNERQLLALGLLMQRIKAVPDAEARHALATVFSDFLRYQNMLCRYDSYALKCQDIFAIHGFPVGLIECENNVLGIPGIGSGAFRHFVEKYDRAKAYCEQPFETIRAKSRKKLVHTSGERIDVSLVTDRKQLKGSRKGMLTAGSVTAGKFRNGDFDAVFTDPPYFDNVQYAELMDFCYVWLRQLLNGEYPEFDVHSTRSLDELTGNLTMGKTLEHFTDGLAKVFSFAARQLKAGGPFVFTYHHNDLSAYIPIVVAILDAGLVCTASLPCPAEMAASLHINGTGSSIMDTIIVCRKDAPATLSSRIGPAALRKWLLDDRQKLVDAGLRTTAGDMTCIALGHLTRIAVSKLRPEWDDSADMKTKMRAAEQALRQMHERCELAVAVKSVLKESLTSSLPSKVPQRSLFDEV